MLELRNFESAVLTPECKSDISQFNTGKILYSLLVQLLSRTSWRLLASCFNIKNSVYLSIGRYKIYRLKGGKSSRERYWK